MSEPSLKLRALSRRFIRDERGIASIIGALLLLLGLSLSVLVVDVGHLYLAKRRLQGAVDAAALAAVGDTANANAIVARILSADGYAQSATVATGAYTPDPSVPAANRFDPDPSAQQNAVRVTETITTPGFLAGIIGGSMLSSVAATATAAQTPMVSFSAGTGLAALSGGQLNAVLGGLLGANLSLSLVNYQALAGTNVDALTFLDQLAAQAGVSAGTYGDLANTNVTVGQMVAAATAALNIHPDGNDSAALDALNILALQAPAAASALVGNLANTAVWQKRQIGSIAQQTPGQVTFNLFDLAVAMARVSGANDGQLANLSTTALTVPGVTSSFSAQLAVGTPMASAALATVGTSVSTTQTRLAINASIVNLTLAGIPIAAVNLPIYLELASGTATVAAIPCQTGGTMVTLATASQAMTAQLGVASASALTNFSQEPALQPAALSITILGVPIAVGVSAYLSVAAGPEANENFTQSDIDNGTVQSAAGSDAGDVLSGLAANIQFTPQAGLSGLLSSLLNPVLTLLQPVLANVFSALDPVVDTLLRTLGLRLGVIDTVVHGVRCGTPTLVS